MYILIRCFGMQAGLDFWTEQNNSLSVPVLIIRTYFHAIGHYNEYSVLCAGQPGSCMGRQIIRDCKTSLE